MNDLLIIYRCCENETPGKPIRKSRPSFFNKIHCLNNLIEVFLETVSFGDKNGIGRYNPSETFVWAVHDGPFGELGNRLEYFSEKNLAIEIDKINVCSNSQSYQHCLKIAKENVKNYKYIYLVEDDYLHTPEAPAIMLEGLDKFGVVTGYFHTDRLTRTDDITRGREHISATASCHWVTNESTTCTFAISGKNKENIISVAANHGIQDRQMWRSLIDYGIRLWVPTPGVSTHLENNLMTPFVDWANI